MKYYILRKPRQNIFHGLKAFPNFSFFLFSLKNNLTSRQSKQESLPAIYAALVLYTLQIRSQYVYTTHDNIYKIYYRWRHISLYIIYIIYIPRIAALCTTDGKRNHNIHRTLGCTSAILYILTYYRLQYILLYNIQYIAGRNIYHNILTQHLRRIKLL